MGADVDHGADARAARSPRFLFWAGGAPWRAGGPVRGVLGRLFRGGGLDGRIRVSWLHPVHASKTDRVLAGGGGVLAGICGDSLAQSRGDLGWVSGGGRDRTLLLPDSVSHGQSVVCGRLPCILGLGADVSIFSARQRDGRRGASHASLVSRAGVADGRERGARGECALLRGDCGGEWGVRVEVSGGAVRGHGFDRRKSPPQRGTHLPALLSLE
jgi:hypothetical protein